MGADFLEKALRILLALASGVLNSSCLRFYPIQWEQPIMKAI